MKTIKISEAAHKELKIFSANVQYSMEVIASDAVLQYIKSETKKSKIKQSSKK